MTDLSILTLIFVVAAVFIAWLAIRTFQRERPALWLLIPAVLGLAAYSWAAVDASKGYPTRDVAELEDGFLYLWHAGQSPTYLLAVPKGGSAPRLYIAPPQMAEEARKGLQQAQEGVKRHVQTFGQFREGEWVLHSLTPQESMPKAD